MTNAVVDRAMRAAFRAWQDEMVRNGKTSALNARFDDIAPRDRRLIELQCRAAIASMKEENEGMEMELEGARTMPDYDPSCDDARVCFNSMIDAALKDG